jgi:hypothetical protein
VEGAFFRPTRKRCRILDTGYQISDFRIHAIRGTD